MINFLGLGLGYCEPKRVNQLPESAAAAAATGAGGSFMGGRQH